MGTVQLDHGQPHARPLPLAACIPNSGLASFPPPHDPPRVRRDLRGRASAIPVDATGNVGATPAGRFGDLMNNPGATLLMWMMALWFCAFLAVLWRKY